jgi:hypothetical protein
MPRHRASGGKGVCAERWRGGTKLKRENDSAGENDPSGWPDFPFGHANVGVKKSLSQLADVCVNEGGIAGLSR